MVSTFSNRTDLAVQAADGNVIAMVEVKNAEGLSAEVAAAIRRSLVARSRSDWWSPFFMVVSQETGYLWDQRSLTAMVCYHSRESMALRFGRTPATRPTIYPSFGPTFDVEGYLHYHGQALVRRFDANSYLYLTKAMDLYDVGRDGGEARWLREIAAPVLLLGIRSDWLFPPNEIRDLTDRLRALGKDATYAELDSPHGHDAFLKEWEQMTPIVGGFLDGVLSAQCSVLSLE